MNLVDGKRATIDYVESNVSDISPEKRPQVFVRRSCFSQRHLVNRFLVFSKQVFLRMYWVLASAQGFSKSFTGV